jgi:hypothetical protein
MCPTLAAAKSYYDEIMPLLGFELFFNTADEFGFMPAGGKRGTYLFVYLAQQSAHYSRHRPGLQHLAFMVPTRSAVKEVHSRVVELHGEVIHEPQEFPQYPPPILQPSGSTRSVSCSKRSVTTTGTEPRPISDW